jgi:hypothetical protein
MHIANIIGYSVAVLIVSLPFIIVAYVLSEDLLIKIRQKSIMTRRNRYGRSRVHNIH